jgi:hypothetical protein
MALFKESPNMKKKNVKLCMLKGRLEMLSMVEGRIIGTHDIILSHCD